MSPRAAWRLQSLGFAEIYDYVAGKADWLANGLHTEGTAADSSRIGAKAHRDTPTCHLDETVGEAARRAADAGYDHCVVVNDVGVVLGILESTALREHAEGRAEDVMRSGPSTFRPNTSVDELRNVLAKGRFHRALVTKPDGRLVGMVFADEL